MRQPNTAVLQILVAALPDAALRPLLLELVLGGAMVAAPLASADGPSATETTTPAPTAKRKGWPRGKPRGPRKPAAAAKGRSRAALDRFNASRRAARAAARKPNGGGNGSTAGDGAAISPAAVWLHAELLDPKAPYRAVARALDLNDQLVLDHFRRGTLPPSISAAQAARFMEMRPAG